MSYYRLTAGPVTDTGGLVLNSINLILGPQGSGKSYLMEKLIDDNRPNFDEIFRVAPPRTLTDHPIHSPKEMEEWLANCDREAAERKEDLKMINSFVSMLRHPDLGIEIPRGLPEVLDKYESAGDVEKPTRRLLAIDDLGGHVMFKTPSSTFSQVARQLRHMGITTIINCHNIRDVSPAIRSYTGSVHLFGGVPVYDLQEIWKNKATPFSTWQGFYQEYLRRTEKTGRNQHPFMRLSFVG